MLRRLTLAFLFVLLALVCAGFVRVNAAPTRVDLYFAALRTTAGQALAAAFVLGFGVGLAAAGLALLRLARERGELARALRLAEGEVRTLRAVAPSHAR